jgi:RNA polymerase sigma-70 factor (ECF subfamily)
VRGPAAALDELGPLSLDGYHLFHATRADLLRRLGRREEAAAAYEAAIAGAANRTERSFLQQQRDSL